MNPRKKMAREYNLLFYLIFIQNLRSHSQDILLIKLGYRRNVFNEENNLEYIFPYQFYQRIYKKTIESKKSKENTSKKKLIYLIKSKLKHQKLR